MVKVRIVGMVLLVCGVVSCGRGVAQEEDWEVMPEAAVGLCEVKMPEDEAQVLLVRKAYVASYNKEKKVPNWVGWLLTASHTEGPYKRNVFFHEDEEVETPRATLTDYRGSGWSRGHICPAGDNKWDEQAMFESFALTNVCPQNANLNQGAWNSIEMKCRMWARKFGEIYVVSGPLYYRGVHETIGENKVAVPEAFFKVVLSMEGEPKAMGVVVKNTDGNSVRDVRYHSVDEVERITGYDFFSALEDEVEERVEARYDETSWR